MDLLFERVITNWRTSLSGTISFVGGAAGIITVIYFPGADAPKALLLVSALSAYTTNLLAKDK